MTDRRDELPVSEAEPPAATPGRSDHSGEAGSPGSPGSPGSFGSPGSAGVGHEVLLVLGVSLGTSAIYSIVSLIGKLTSRLPLAQTHATLNGSRAPDRPLLDLALQLVSIGAGVVPALLALHLLDRDRIPPAAVGLDLHHRRFDLIRGGLVAAAIGIPGLLLYLAAHAAGLSATVVAESLPDVWWRYPVLLLSAAMNGTLEEVVVVAYLMTRLRQLGWPSGRTLLASALLRGSYHLYQGFGAFLGNAAMGLVFGRYFQRTGRAMPLVIAHTVVDAVAFIGYAALHGRVSWLP